MALSAGFDYTVFTNPPSLNSGFSPIFQHNAVTGEASAYGPIFQHRVEADDASLFGPIFQHNAVIGSPSSFGPIFQHTADIAALGKIRGPQLQSPLPIERAIDIEDGSETTSPVGSVRLYAKDKTLRFVNEDGLNVNLGLLGVPLGGIISWFPLVGTSLPESFEYCDGTAVTTANSPMFGFFKPALMRTTDAPGATQRFIKGADTTSTYGAGSGLSATQGGVATHLHTGTTNTDGDHRHDPGNHIHTIPQNNAELASTGGAIIDPFLGGEGDVLLSDAPSPDVEEVHHHDVVIPDHDHTGETGQATLINSGQGTVDFAGDHEHDFTSDSVSNDPLHVELAWIIRVI